MKEIMTVPIELIAEAENVSRMRGRMKAYLTAFGRCYNKFTVTENDTFLGHVSESAIIGYLEERYGDRLEIKKWSDHFDMKRINSAIENNDGSPEAVDYVKDYFYDRYDLEIIERKSGKSIFVDVKTAETSKQPKDTWNFLYPVVQNHRSGKDCVILCYYYKLERENKIILVGYMSEEDISKKKILPAGSKTRFGTVNQIDNYETRVTDYQQLAIMLNMYYGYLGRINNE